MAAPIRFLSGRQQQQKIGIEGSTDNQKVLEVVGQVGIGTTVFEPSVQLEVRGDASVSGVLTTGSLNVTGSSSVPATLTVESLNATGVSTFGGAVDINAGLDVDGQSDLDEVVVAGVATFSNAVDINSTLDVDGDTQLDDLNVAGVSTFSSVVNATAAVNATDIIKGYKYTAVPYGSTVTLAVTVASKDSTHRYNGTGSGNAYVIDGIQAPFLTLTPGRTYRFTNDNTGSHPLKFYLEADKTTLYETNVNFQNTYTEITVTDETPIVLHYQCTSHGFMGNAVQTNANVVNTNYPATIRSTLDVSGVSTFTQLDVSTGGLDVDGLTNLDEVIVAGVSTFTGNIVAATAEFSGNVTIGGTLTSENKTNIDSVGLVTARTGVRVIAGGIDVTAGVSTFGGAVNFNDGVGVVGGLTADSLTISGITTGINAAGISSFVRINVDGQADLDEVVIAGVATFQGAVNFDVNSEINIGTGVTILGNNLHVTGIVSAAQFIGDGSGITNLPGISTLGSSNLTDVNVSGTTTTVQLRISGVGTAEKFFVSTGGFEVDGQSDLDELIVAGVSTFSANTFINADLSVTGDIGASGIITATGINLVAGSGLDVGAVGVLTALSVDVSTGGIDVDGQATLDEVVVAGVATFSALADVNNRLDVAGGANIDQLNVAGIASFTQLDVSTGGIDVDGQATLDEVVVSGASTFTGTVKIDGALDIGVAGVDVEGLTNLDELIVAGVSTFSSDISIADKIVHTGDTNTALRFPSADTFTVETGGSERVRVNSDGKLLLGATSLVENNNFGPNISFQVSSDVTGVINAISYNNTFDGAIEIMRARGTAASPTNVVDNVGLGNVNFYGYNSSGASGDKFQLAAGVGAIVDGTPGIGSQHMPGALIFKTATASTGLALERVRITSAGNVNFLGSLVNVNATGVSSFVQLDVSTGGLDVDGQTDLDEVVVSGASTFTGAVKIDGALDIGTAGVDIDGQTDLDELQVAGVSTFSAKAVFNTAYPSIDADNEIQVGTAIQLGKAGVVTATTFVGNLTGDVTGTASNASGATSDFSIADKIIHTGDTNTAIRFPAADTFTVETGGAEALRVNSSQNVNFLGSLVNVNATGVSSFVQLDVSTGGIDVDGQATLDEVVVAGVSTFSAKAVFNTAYPSIDADNEIQVGTAIQLGKAGVITATSFSGSGANLTGIAATDHVSTFDLVVAGISTFVGVATFKNDAYFTGSSDKNLVWDSSDGNLEFADNAKATFGFGTGGDLQIWHDGTSYIKNTEGELRIASDTIRIGNEGNTENFIVASADGAVVIYHDALQKFSTADTGIQVTGTLAATNVSAIGGNYTGVVTATSFSGSGANLTGIGTQGPDGSFRGLTVAGISTFNDDVRILAGGLDVTGIITAVGAEFDGTSHIKLPAGSTGQRPGSPTAGDLRYNSDDGAFEGYTDSWGAIGGGTPEVDTNVSSTSVVGVGSFATASFRSAEVVAQISQVNVGAGVADYQVGKYLMIHDGTIVTVIEQAAVSTGDSMIGSFDGAINGSNVELRVTMVSSGIATVTTKISTITV